MIDSDGFRPNVGIIITDHQGRVFWGKRVGQDAWQFPQGGIKQHESPEQALFRELEEEVGLSAADVKIIGRTKGWLRYRLPKRMIRQNSHPICVGQKQRWYLLKVLNPDVKIDVFNSSSPEFDGWRWVSYWYPLGQVVAFKREVYRKALKELVGRLPKNGELAS